MLRKLKRKLVRWAIVAVAIVFLVQVAVSYLD